MEIEILMDVRTGGRVNNVRPATSYRDHTRASGVEKFTIEFVKNTGGRIDASLMDWYMARMIIQAGIATKGRSDVFG